MMVIDFQNQEIWLLKTKSWKLTRLNSFHRYLRIQKNSINTFFLTFFCTKWYKLNCEKRKARFSCSFWQINMVWAAKTSQTREVEGAATHFFHVHVSGAIKKGKTFILTIKCGGGEGISLTWLLGNKNEGCLWFSQEANPPPYRTLREKTLPIVCDFGRLPLRQEQLIDRPQAEVSNPEK